MSQNVILVVVDALRADRVGAMGNEKNLTPNIDELAEEGVIFGNAFASTNATDPSITSIHSGQDPAMVVEHHGPYVTETEKRRAETVTTVPERLQNADIRTVAAGRLLSRWHESGFDQYPEPTLSRNRRRAIGERLETIHPKLRNVAGSLYEELPGLLSDRTAENEIDDVLELLNRERFYGFVHLMDTHAPYEPEEELVEELLAEYDYPQRSLDEFFENHQDNPFLYEFIRENATPSDYAYGVGRLIAGYDAAVRKADRKIGQLVDELRQRGRYEETTIIVTSDHGESLDEHGIYFDHHGLYDESIHVPLIIRGPETSQHSRNELVQLYDIAPTILQLLGIDGEFGEESQSLCPLLDGRASWSDREYIVAREAHAQSRVAIRTQEWKYIKYVEDPVLERERGDSFRCGYCDSLHGSEEELYDLIEDPRESENVVSEYPDEASELNSELDAYRESLQMPTTDDEQSVQYDDESEVMDRLEDLGYR